MVNIKGLFSDLVKWFILWSTTSIVNCKEFDNITCLKKGYRPHNYTDTCCYVILYSQHGSLKTQYLSVNKFLYIPLNPSDTAEDCMNPNADSSLIQKIFINTQLPPVASLFFYRTEAINGAIHYMYTVPLSPWKWPIN